MTDTAPQPMPTPGAESVTRAVMADLVEREQLGIARYGTTLQTFNGRDALADAYQESIDQTQYLKQALMERDAGTAAAWRKAYDAMKAEVVRLGRLLAAAEACYADARTTAERLVIEREQYEQAVRNLTERAEFASQRADAEEAARDELDQQIDRLATFIMAHVPGEPSQSQGAIDTAIRLLTQREA